MAEPFGVLLLSGTHDRAHYAFVLATAAAAIGRDVTLFASNAGCRALLADWRGLDGAGLHDSGRDAVLVASGVAGLDTLLAAADELAVHLVACEAGLRGEAIDPAALRPGVVVAGAVSFLEAVRGGTVVTC